MLAKSISYPMKLHVNVNAYSAVWGDIVVGYAAHVQSKYSTGYSEISTVYSYSEPIRKSAKKPTQEKPTIKAVVFLLFHPVRIYTKKCDFGHKSDRGLF